MSVFYDVLMEKTASNKMRKMIEIYDNPLGHSEKQVRRAYNYIKGRLGEGDELDDLLMRGTSSHLATRLRYGGGDVFRRGAYHLEHGTGRHVPYTAGKNGMDLTMEHIAERVGRGVKYTHQPPLSNPRTPSKTQEPLDLEARLSTFKKNKEKNREISRAEYEAAQEEADRNRLIREAEDAVTYNNRVYKERARMKRDAGYAQDTSGVEDLGGLVPYVPPAKRPSPQQQSNLKRNLLLAGAGLTTAGGAGYMYHRRNKKRSEQR